MGNIEYNPYKAGTDQHPGAAMIALLESFQFDRTCAPEEGDTKGLDAHKAALGEHADRIVSTLDDLGIKSLDELCAISQSIDVSRFSGSPAAITVGMGKVFKSLGANVQYLQLSGTNTAEGKDKCFGFATDIGDDTWIFAPGFSAPLAVPLNGQDHSIRGVNNQVQELGADAINLSGREGVSMASGEQIAAEITNFGPKYLGTLTQSQVRAVIDSGRFKIVTTPRDREVIGRNFGDIKPVEEDTVLDRRNIYQKSRADNSKERIFRVESSARGVQFAVSLLIV